MPAKTKVKKKSRKIRREAHLLPRPLRIIIISVLLIVLIVGLAQIADKNEDKNEVRGTAKLTEKQLQSLSDKEKYQSLDLRVAKLAVYKGAPLTITKDLGVFGGVRQKVFSFPVYSSNLVEHGLLTLPPSSPPPDGYPVVILLHGYVNPPHYSTSKFYLTQMEFFSQHGFAVIKPDLRGQGLSIKAGRPEGAYFSMAYNVDVQSLIASVKLTNYLNSNNINLWGHSMGAYIALRAAVLNPEIKRLVLLSGPVGKIQDMYKDYIPPSDRSNPVAQLIKNTELTKHGTPISNPNFWYYVSPFNFLNQLDAKVQIHVGALDQVVPPKFSAELDAGLIDSHKPHEYYVYDDGDHGLVAEMPQILQRNLTFLQSN